MTLTFVASSKKAFYFALDELMETKFDKFKMDTIGLTMTFECRDEDECDQTLSDLKKIFDMTGINGHFIVED